MPAVSIIIPTYNRAGTILRALASVFEQTYRDYEILVIDDGSRDHTARLLEPYHQRLRYVFQENGGASAARNRGVQLAQADLIAFLDSDDEWLPHKLEKQVAFLAAHPQIGFLGCLAGPEESRFRRADYQPPRDPFRQFLISPFPQNMSRYVVRRECFLQCGLFDTSLHGPEDWEFWLRLLRHSCRFDFLEETLVRYYHSEDAISGRPLNMLEGERKIHERYVQTLARLSDRLRVGARFRARSYFSAALAFRDRGETVESRRYAWRALCASPFGPGTVNRLKFLAKLALQRTSPAAGG